MKTYVCRKMWIYNRLSNDGFEPYKVQRDKYNPKFTIWLYDETTELRDKIEQYYADFAAQTK